MTEENNTKPTSELFQARASEKQEDPAYSFWRKVFELLFEPLFWIGFLGGVVLINIILYVPLMGGMRKPIIYLYPAKTQTISVDLRIDGKLTYTYPAYNSGWTVTAHPDGTLINHADKREYSYLFWEGETHRKYDFSKGFVVKGEDTVAFLQEKLAQIGLLPKEYNEFIVFWLPQMQDKPYNLITFQGKAYTDGAKLTITPKPDSVLRVFMAYKPLKSPIQIPPQELKPFERKGFTVVEWGGTEVR